VYVHVSQFSFVLTKVDYVETLRTADYLSRKFYERSRDLTIYSGLKEANETSP
jgi:hypothetical protein